MKMPVPEQSARHRSISSQPDPSSCSSLMRFVVPPFLSFPSSLVWLRFRRRSGPLGVLVISGWCGLAAGQLELLARVLFRNFSVTNGMCLMTRHFFWLVPLTYLFLFLSMGLVLALATRLWPRLRRGG